MQYLKVKNWESFQQYKDREPKWIKVYRTLLMDYKFEQLTDAEFGALVKIWLLASQIDNYIPNDPSFIQRKCGLSQKPNIKKYLQLDFLVLSNSYKYVQDCTETYLETDKIREDKETDKSKKFVPPSLEDVINYFQEKGYSEESAKRAFEYYNNADPPWTDSNGKKVRSWKSKMIAVWFKDENKEHEDGLKRFLRRHQNSE